MAHGSWLMADGSWFFDGIDQRADTFAKLDSISFEFPEFNILYPSTPTKYYQKRNSLEKRASGNIKEMNKLLFGKTTFSLCYVQSWRCCSAFQLFNKPLMSFISLDSFKNVKTLIGKINCLLPNFQILKRKPIVIHYSLSAISHEPSAMNSVHISSQ